MKSLTVRAIIKISRFLTKIESFCDNALQERLEKQENVIVGQHEALTLHFAQLLSSHAQKVRQTSD